MTIKTVTAPRKLLDEGYTAHVYRLPDTRKVVKSFLPGCISTHFPAELKAYERFTARGHPSEILEYYGVDPDDPAGIILELAAGGNVAEYLWRHIHDPPSGMLLYRWARQAASGLGFAHSCGVLHSDIHCVNFLLDESLDLKVADFAGASIDGSRSHSSYRRTHALPEIRRTGISVRSEVFGLGSALYYMVTGADVFDGELDYEDNKAEIVRRLGEGEFPETEGLRALGRVITRCWRLEYTSMEEVKKGIEEEEAQQLLSQRLDLDDRP